MTRQRGVCLAPGSSTASGLQILPSQKQSNLLISTHLCKMDEWHQKMAKFDASATEFFGASKNSSIPPLSSNSPSSNFLAQSRIPHAVSPEALVSLKFCQTYYAYRFNATRCLPQYESSKQVGSTTMHTGSAASNQQVTKDTLGSPLPSDKSQNFTSTHDVMEFCVAHRNSDWGNVADRWTEARAGKMEQKSWRGSTK